MRACRREGIAPAPLALRQHRLPRFWLALTLGSVALAVGGVYWWERQLPDRIASAVSRGDMQSCLRYGEQLAALSWLPGREPLEQGRCRRERAQQLWRGGNWGAALELQRQLIHSPTGLPSDQEQLNRWRSSLRNAAIARYRNGDLAGAQKRLQPIGEASALGAALRQNWERNRLLLQRADGLQDQGRWWEALDTLHRIDHPWWRSQAAALQKRVEQAIARLPREEQEHEGHGSLPHTVDNAQLDARVRRNIVAGMEEGRAFELACRQSGGQVVEAGPDSACQRRQ